MIRVRFPFNAEIQIADGDLKLTSGPKYFEDLLKLIVNDEIELSPSNPNIERSVADLLIAKYGGEILEEIPEPDRPPGTVF